MEQLPPMMIVIERLVAGAILGLLPMILAWHYGRPNLVPWSYFITIALALVLGFLWAASFAFAVAGVILIGVWRREKMKMHRGGWAEEEPETKDKTKPTGSKT